MRSGVDDWFGIAMQYGLPAGIQNPIAISAHSYQLTLRRHNCQRGPQILS